MTTIDDTVQKSDGKKVPTIHELMAGYVPLSSLRRVEIGYSMAQIPKLKPRKNLRDIYH